MTRFGLVFEVTKEAGGRAVLRMSLALEDGNLSHPLSMPGVDPASIQEGAPSPTLGGNCTAAPGSWKRTQIQEGFGLLWGRCLFRAVGSTSISIPWGGQGFNLRGCLYLRS
jgi:hypothetical protein